MKNNKTVMPKQAAPVERNSTATAAGAGAGGVEPSFDKINTLQTNPFAGSDAE
ncbi:MAG: anacyclamide/piricyclamide family prenylated cyclic peptide [Oscillatoria princeps RMCB-10]|jgi:prenylated cyclic peptide (anacyclamide/piricyclamide family)|nr:anacyclamide/piricyclamide family prenylated cyclic peptide [Oscillatoria princeps RMCB-10]